MKRQGTIEEDIKEHGFADGSKFVSNAKTPIIDLDCEDFYEKNLWAFDSQRTVSRKAYPDLSLLGLPVELRLQILRYLLPDVDTIKLRDLRYRTRPHKAIWNYRNAKRGIWHHVSKAKREERMESWEAEIKYNYSALRHDLESCDPAVMRVNRQLYAEAAQIMYQDREFGAVLLLDEFKIFSRAFDVEAMSCDFSIIERYLRHISDLSIVIYTDSNFCPFTDADDHSCAAYGCTRKRVDGIRNVADFLSQCVGLSCLTINIISNDYTHATSRRPVVAKEVRRVESQMLSFVKPFGMIRNLAWSSIKIIGRPPRDWPNSSPKFCTELETMEQQMRIFEAPPQRPDFAITKRMFHDIFAMNVDYAESAKKHMGIDVSELEQRCWEACDSGNRAAVMKQHKELSRVWEEQKRIVEGFLNQIGHTSAREAKWKGSKNVGAQKEAKLSSTSG